MVGRKVWEENFEEKIRLSHKIVVRKIVEEKFQEKNKTEWSAILF